MLVERSPKFGAAATSADRLGPTVPGEPGVPQCPLEDTVRPHGILDRHRFVLGAGGRVLRTVRAQPFAEVLTQLRGWDAGGRRHCSLTRTSAPQRQSKPIS